MKAHPEIDLNFSHAPETDATVYLADNVSPLAIEKSGPFVRNARNELVFVEGRSAFLSKDEGQTWQDYPLFDSDDFLIQDTRSFWATESGVLVCGFINLAKEHLKWVKKTNLPTKNSFLALWTVRSLDGGLTWQAPVQVQGGYCGATTTMIQLSSGELVMSAQALNYAEGRHYSLTYQSNDEGHTWQASNHIDIGGQGHHDGCFEGTLVETADGRVWYLLRTNLDYFWSAFSEDKGMTWTQMNKSAPSSSSPAMFHRLQSGRLMLVYNQLYKVGETEAPRRSGLSSKAAASWQREELSIAFSDDDGRSWQMPEVIASCEGAWLSYPYVFEPEAGVVWITTLQSGLKVVINEKDWC